MKKVQFNLAYYLDHHPVVVTRDGRDARIICTDAESVADKEPVVALIKTIYELEGTFITEHPYKFNRLGSSFLSTVEHGSDLFMMVDYEE